MAYRTLPTTRVSRRTSLINAQIPDLHLDTSGSFTSASATFRSPSSSSGPPTLTPYIPSSLSDSFGPSFASFSDTIQSKAAEYLETPATRKFVSILKRASRHVHYVHIFCFAWLVLIWFGERTVPYNTLRQCAWNQWENWPEESQPARVVLVSDPQIVDAHTYPGRPRILQSITEYITDLYLRRNWVYINEILDADANFFIGDLFDGGREWKDREWRSEFMRFNKIYTKPPYKRTVMSLPGNHDIGFGNTKLVHAAQRFSMYFGEPSSKHIVGNHTFVLLDTISLMNNKDESVYKAPEEFMQSIAFTDEFEEYPRILLTHVPLYRAPGVSCGPNRESKNPIPFVHGFQYQTMISAEISDWVLRYMRPSVVFSGDDHDACQVKHNFTTPVAGVERTLHADEYTVKSASMAMGVSRPAVQLVSLYNDVSQNKIVSQGKTFQTEICYMPSPFYSIILYGLFLIFTLTVILIVNFLPPLFPPVVLKVLSKQPWTDLDSPVSGYGRSPFLPTYEDEQKYEDSEKKKFDNTLWRAKNMIRQPSNWKGIAIDIVIIATPAIGFFIFLASSIYWR